MGEGFAGGAAEARAGTVSAPATTAAATPAASMALELLGGFTLFLPAVPVPYLVISGGRRRGPETGV
ncbi:hypothetical protein Ssi03_36520 [Sphaerisporangium siamense]|nr:hypothetical protein Ssi03_36520 [Sphaerisporangium siamense]